MAGISAIGMIGFFNRMSSAFQGQQLTPATKAKLEALGVDTSWIKTEAEGRAKLQEVQFTQGSRKSNKSSKNEGEDAVMAKIKQLAYNLNVSYSDSDTADDIINRITIKVRELVNQAGDDNTKKEYAQYYEGKLDEVKRMQLSQIDLQASMSVTANMNMFFHGLY